VCYPSYPVKWEAVKIRFRHWHNDFCFNSPPPNDLQDKKEFNLCSLFCIWYTLSDVCPVWSGAAAA